MVGAYGRYHGDQSRQFAHRHPSRAGFPSAMTAPFRRIAVLDIGKTNAKVVILDAETGTEIAAVRTSNDVVRSGPYPHYDVERLWDFTLNALAGFVSEPGFDAVSI